jgi:uncharacterized protein (TIGR02270 family)
VLVSGQGALSAADQFWTAWSMVLLGETGWLGTLWDAAFTAAPYSWRALDLAARASPTAESKRQLEIMRARPEMMPAAVDGAAASGDPAHLPWLLECLAEPLLARRAAVALCTIVGIDLEEDQAVGDAPPDAPSGPSDDPEDDDVALDPDHQLLWPNVAVVTRLCHARAAGLRAGARYLLGRPVTADCLTDVLRDGSQLHRRAAAFEQALLTPGLPLAETRNPVLVR